MNAGGAGRCWGRCNRSILTARLAKPRETAANLGGWGWCRGDKARCTRWIWSSKKPLRRGAAATANSLQGKEKPLAVRLPHACACLCIHLAHTDWFDPCRAVSRPGGRCRLVCRFFCVPGVFPWFAPACCQAGCRTPGGGVGGRLAAVGLRRWRGGRWGKAGRGCRVAVGGWVANGCGRCWGRWAAVGLSSRGGVCTLPFVHTGWLYRFVPFPRAASSLLRMGRCCCVHVQRLFACQGVHGVCPFAAPVGAPICGAGPHCRFACWCAPAASVVLPRFSLAAA